MTTTFVSAGPLPSTAPGTPSNGATGRETEPSAPTKAEAAPRNYALLAAQVKAAATPPIRCRVYGYQESLDGSERYELLIVDIPAAQPARFHVLINGGTHGEEPAGAEAVMRFLKDQRFERWPEIAFTLLPCTNPWGYTHNRREGPGGIDLNRSFRRAGPRTREVSLLKRALRRHTYDMYLDCHEDVDAPGLYVFSTKLLGGAIVAAAGEVGPLHPGPDVDGQIPLENSVVDFGSRRVTQSQRRFTAWPLPRYIGRYHLRLLAAEGSAAPDAENVTPSDMVRARHATIETPTFLPMEQRIAMHHAAIDAALGVLTSTADPAGTATVSPIAPQF